MISYDGYSVIILLMKLSKIKAHCVFVVGRMKYGEAEM